MKKLLLACVGTAVASTCYGQDLNLRDSFRCGNNIVSRGDSGIEVIEKCGQPTYKAPDGGWVYDQGPQEFIYVLYVYGSKVQKIYSSTTWGKVVKDYPAKSRY